MKQPERLLRTAGAAVLTVVLLNAAAAAVGRPDAAASTSSSARMPASVRTAAQDTAWDNAIARFAAQLARDVEVDGIGSISAAVIERGEPAWSKAFGWADRDAKRAADANTIYRVGSITKSFTAVLLALLAQDGVLGLDQPVRTHLAAVDGFADPPAEVAPITYRQLASHTAGLIREPRLAGAAAGPFAEWEAKILASIPTTSFQSRPGTEYAYSNIGFGVLGLALRRAAGEPFPELIRKRIFAPLGMSSSTFVLTPALRARLATGYANRRNGAIDADAPAREHDGRGYKVPNGGIYSTVGDLGRFIAGVTGTAGPEILSAATRAEVLRVQTPEDPRSGYGLGFQVQTLEDGTRLIGHGGSVAGYTAHLLFEPTTGIGVVLLRNYASGETNLGGAARTVLRALLAARRRG